MKTLERRFLKGMQGLIISTLLVLTGSLMAQVPQAFKYQAVVRHISGEPIVSGDVSVRISLIIHEPAGAPVYQEVHDVITSPNGLITLDIGTGNIEVGSFNEIVWGLASYFVKIEVDPFGGTNFIHMGTSQLLSVPYAIHAREAGGPPSYTWEQLQNFFQGGVTPTPGMMVYVSDENRIVYYNGTQWMTTSEECFPPPSVADAGPDQVDVEGTSTVLQANDPKHGSGLWSIISQENGTVVGFSDYSNPHALFSTTGGNFVLQWTVTNECGDNSDQVYISFCPPNTIAIAGPDQFSIIGTSAQLTANEPAIGNTGTWSVTTGVGGSFTNFNDPLSAFSGLPGNTYTVRWTIATGCDSNFDELQIGFCYTLTLANAGNDQINVNGTSTTLQGNQPGAGNTGTWTIISGVGGSLLDPSAHNTTFTGLPNTGYVLRWAINSDCQDAYDDVAISFCPVLTIANAGVDQINIDGTSAQLAGNVPGVANTGIWAVVSGTGGSFANPNVHNTIFNGQPGQTYQLSWTITTVCGSSSDQVTIGFCPLNTMANAGDDQSFIVGTSTQLTANVPAAGNTGTWSVISGVGGSFSNLNNPVSVFSGLAGNTYVLRWTIATACHSNSDEVQIRFCYAPTLANAGNDQLNVNATSTTLQGNQPGAGNTGTWTILSGAGGSLLNPSTHNTTFTGLPNTGYVLRWAIHSYCQDSYDDVAISFCPVLTIANAGADQLNINGSSTQLAGNVPGVANTGTWTVVSGTGGSFANPNVHNTIFNGQPGQTYQLSWTITTVCGSSSDQVTIGFCPSLVTADAGADVPAACVPHNLAANSPGAGNTGQWTIISGTGGSFVNPSSPTSGFWGVAGTSYELQWTISNACGSSSDNVIITFEPIPCVANAGPDQLNIEGTTVVLAANTPVIGSGLWSVIAGQGGSFTNPSQPNTTFTGATGVLYTLEWRISNTCYFTADQMNVSLVAPFVCGDNLVDPRDSQVYPTVLINNRCWMARNLNIGTQIFTTPSNNGIIEKYCFNHEPVNCVTFGGMYSWDELMAYSTTPGTQGICPPGWFVPTRTDYNNLIAILGGTSIAGGRMKETGNVHWNNNVGATNSSGFTALGGGFHSGMFIGLRATGNFASSTPSAGNYFHVRLYSAGEMADVLTTAKATYMAVRCVKL